MINSRILTGEKIPPVLDALADLRIEVFRHWPYLYEGDREYERDYLNRYQLPGSVVVVAYDGEKIIGASTAALMEDHAQEFGQAFEKTSLKIKDIFYLAESVLLPQYRGRGLGHVFFDGREEQAKKMGRKFCAFCSVIRPLDHPERPADYRPLNDFWARRGYAPLSGVIANFPWKDRGEESSSLKQMQFWLKEL